MVAFRSANGRGGCAVPFSAFAAGLRKPPFRGANGDHRRPARIPFPLHPAGRPWYVYPAMWPTRNKLADWPTVLAAREECRRAGRVVVWTNGCFDLLHPGHVSSLQAARRLGDVLVVGLNSDSSVRTIKGLSRPILSQGERAAMLAALECVDYVLIFDEPTPAEVLAKLQPDIHCKGAEYAPPHGRPVPERAIVEGYGGRIEYLPIVAVISTTELLRRIRGEAGRAAA
jgi:D-glycero-beta-D-manno-heptose 1-phosphate adenylyltransferase